MLFYVLTAYNILQIFRIESEFSQVCAVGPNFSKKKKKKVNPSLFQQEQAFSWTECFHSYDQVPAQHSDKRLRR